MRNLFLASVIVSLLGSFAFAKDLDLKAYILGEWNSAYIPFSGFDSISREVVYTDQDFQNAELASQDYRTLNYVVNGLKGCRIEALAVPIEDLDYEVDSYNLDRKCKAQLAKDLAAEGFINVIIENRDFTDRSSHSDLEATITFVLPEGHHVSSFAPILESKASTKNIF